MFFKIYSHFFHKKDFYDNRTLPIYYSLCFLTHILKFVFQSFKLNIFIPTITFGLLFISDQYCLAWFWSQHFLLFNIRISFFTSSPTVQVHTYCNLYTRVFFQWGAWRILNLNDPRLHDSIRNGGQISSLFGLHWFDIFHLGNGCFSSKSCSSLIAVSMIL